MKIAAKTGLVALLVVAMAAGFAFAKTRHDRGWLGVYTQTVDEDLAKAFDLSIDRGAIVNGIVEDSPAEKCGIKEDDIITAVGDDKVYDQIDLVDMIADVDPGTDVTITVIREGKEKKLTAKIDNWRDDEDRFYLKDSFNKAKNKFYSKFKEQAYIGVSLIDVSEALAANMGGDDHGVIINEVEPDSPAQTAGLKAGDMIVAVDGEKVYDASDVQGAIRDHKKDEIARVDIIRDKKPKSLDVTVGERADTFYSGTPWILNVPDLPHINLSAPKMKGLHRSLDFDFGGYDSEEMKEELEELKADMKQLKEELGELRKQLE